jgi:hypothetical protein
MRTLAMLLLSAAMAATFGGTPARSQAQCKEGATITVTGTILDAYEDKRDDGTPSWIIEVDEQGDGECDVEEIWGTGRLPRGCAEGRRFRATGEYSDDPMLEMAGLEAVLFAQRITCN